MSSDVKNAQNVRRYVGCGRKYIGKIGDLRKIVTLHNQQILDINTRLLQVNSHIDNCASSKNPKYSIFFIVFQNAYGQYCK